MFELKSSGQVLSTHRTHFSLILQPTTAHTTTRLNRSDAARPTHHADLKRHRRLLALLRQQGASHRRTVHLPGSKRRLEWRAARIVAPCVTHARKCGGVGASRQCHRDGSGIERNDILREGPVCCEEKKNSNSPFSHFPMFVPSMSWQTFGF